MYQYDAIRIRGIVSAIPDQVLNNADLAKGEDEKSVLRQIRVTGIKNRVVCRDGQRAADLCIHAAERLMERLGWSGDDVTCLVFVTSYASYRIPSTAFFMKKELGLKDGCLAYDVNLACSGFIVGLQTIGALFEGREEGSRALLLVSDTTSESVDGKDPATRILFGDAGVAIAVEKNNGYPLRFLQMSDGRGYRDIIREDGDHDFIMDGMSVFNFSLGDVVETIKQFLNGIREERIEVDYYYLHQAQKFIVDKVADLSGIGKENVSVTYDRYGNTGCASIPLTMCETSGRFVGSMKTVFACGFGAGHSWGCASMVIAPDTYFEVISSGAIYDDGIREDVRALNKLELNGVESKDLCESSIYQGYIIEKAGLDYSGVGELTETVKASACEAIEGYDKKRIKILILVTQDEEFLFPSTAFRIQKELDIPNECVVYDINLGADGMLTGIETAMGLLKPYSDEDKALVIAADREESVSVIVGKDTVGHARFMHLSRVDDWDITHIRRFAKRVDHQSEIAGSPVPIARRLVDAVNCPDGIHAELSAYGSGGSFTRMEYLYGTE